MVFKNHDQSDDSSGMMSKTPTSKFLGKARAGNSQYTSTNSSVGGLEYSKYSEQDVQEEFLRLYTQLELLKEKNMRIGNRHLASKITAMQDAARSHDHVQSENPSRSLGKLNNTLDIVPEKSGNDVNAEDDTPVKIKRQSVSFASETETGGDSTVKDNNSCSKIIEEVTAEGAGASIELKSRDERNESPAADRNGRYLKSGHARTHAIVINLDDKSRFTEEVTV
ncbi:hypothetical protein BDFB_008764 [Asbolus verrucosus]|uniref:Uncharacterized protein n=1 Tax=Asbolus verrucosus TaxID=1661398 RepID=A0A482W1D7_ASBVE|nr:hypothetical protein BDFB_008764 [Asbolus verrucosus]